MSQKCSNCETLQKALQEILNITMAHLKVKPLENVHKPENEIQKLIKGWKLLTGIPVEGIESAKWDKVHFPRSAASAKKLIFLFGFEEAVNCMEWVYNYLQKKNLSCTLETTVKCSDMYREQQARREP